MRLLTSTELRTQLEWLSHNVASEEEETNWWLDSSQ